MRGLSQWEQLCTSLHMEPNKLWRSNSIFNLCLDRLYSTCTEHPLILKVLSSNSSSLFLFERHTSSFPSCKSAFPTFFGTALVSVLYNNLSHLPLWKPFFFSFLKIRFSYFLWSSASFLPSLFPLLAYPYSCYLTDRGKLIFPQFFDSSFFVSL